MLCQMRNHPEPDREITNKLKVELDFCNYVTKSGVEKATSDNTSN